MEPFRDLTLRYSYFAEPDRVLLLHVPKAAGTSLLWRIFAAHAFDPEEIARVTAHPEVAWDQALWSQTDRVLLNSVSEEVRYGYLADPSIRKVAFLRDPVSRLWSAWVSKVLTGEPAYANVRDDLYGPFDSLSVNVGTTREDLADLFDLFVDWLPSSALFYEDGHFMSQARLLDGAPSDTEILDVRNLDEHLVRLAPSLATTPTTRRRNVTQELVHGPVMSRDTYEVIARLYEDDFAQWGTRLDWDYPSAWDIDRQAAGSPVSEAFVERARAARRLATVWNSMDRLRSERDGAMAERDGAMAERDGAMAERDGAMAELQLVLTSRTWRWTSWWRHWRSRRTFSP